LVLLKKDEGIAAGFIQAYLSQCHDGKWVVIITVLLCKSQKWWF